MKKYEADKLKRENENFLEIAKCFHALEVTLFSSENTHATSVYIERIKSATGKLKKAGIETRTLVEFWRTL